MSFGLIIAVDERLAFLQPLPSVFFVRLRFNSCLLWLLIFTWSYPSILLFSLRL